MFTFMHISFLSLKVKTLLDDLESSYSFNREYINNAQINMLKERVYDQYLQEWFRELNDRSKLPIYKSYKSQFCIEKYFECVTNESH